MSRGTDARKEEPDFITPIEGLRKITTRPAQYEVWVDGRKVRIGNVATLRSWKRFTDAVFEQTNAAPKLWVPRGHTPQTAWTELLEMVLAPAITEDIAPEDASVDGLLVETVRRWLMSLRCDDDPAGLESGQASYQRKDGRLCFTGRQLYNHLETRPLLRGLGPRDIWPVLREEGYTSTKQRTGPGKAQVIQVWVAPKEIVPSHPPGEQMEPTPIPAAFTNADWSEPEDGAAVAASGTGPDMDYQHEYSEADMPDEWWPADESEPDVE